MKHKNNNAITVRWNEDELQKLTKFAETEERTIRDMIKVIVRRYFRNEEKKATRKKKSA